MPDEMKVPFEKLVNQLNGFMTSVYDALNKNLDFDINIKGQWKTFESIADGSGVISYSFATSVQSPRGISIENIYDITSGTKVLVSDVYSMGSWGIDIVNNLKQIVFQGIQGLTAGNKYEITILVKG